ncbi:Bifunctional xylanase/deacetylase precursor [Solibacillus isronensis B3W22]|uniref:Bifunctional xylanase/deacetylase n=1 Tax=Solibacillus isronensis B3W22 TaxID=1224748 RepID=K1LQG8_9BACL|nr:polysaccharide deacetylase family protein [Solibacillus isronensis]AMO85816.1 polysaccharide deacetylase [Solibacillus silvestris]EKB46474.1 Bifunctional xylanase/deacetylase precursor [Solibacillus isronensis B3W22]
MKKKLIIAVILMALLFAGMFKITKLRTFQIFGGLTYQAETKDKVIALTFDDGPTKNVDQLLPLLDEYKVKATFFLIGNEIEKHPEEAKKLVEAGHQIGNHTYSHKRMVLKSLSFIEEEIEKTDELIRSIGYAGEIDFRPPYGKKFVGLPYYLNKTNRETIMWSLDPETYYTSVDDKVDYVLENIKPGSIILLHPMYDQTGGTLEVVETILKELSNEGYRFLTVDELQSL